MANFNILKKYYRIGAFLLGVFVILGLVFLRNLPQNPEGGNSNSRSIESSISQESLPINIFEITGQVNHPGVYEVKDNLMVIELINLAGGFTSSADLEAIHKNIPLSKDVEPQEKIYIPGIFENSPKSAVSSTSGQKININTATQQELEALPDIGESTASKIISSRPFSKLDDLKNVEGIGDITYNNIVSKISL